jgi:Mor family transcriptional regulator
MHDDLIADILARIRACCSPKAAEKIDLGKIEAEVRRDWGGERHYIAKEGEDARALLVRRDRRIREQARQGEHVPLLARRWRLSERRIRQILSAG